MAGEARRKRMRELLALAGARDADPALFDEAFVHESALKERLAPRSNERLEFVGDAVLGFVVARSLYDRYPDAPEGELALRKSSLVSDAALAATAERLGFNRLLVVGGSLAGAPSSRRGSALADAFEAFLATLHAVCGMETVETFVAHEHVAHRERAVSTLDDPKTVLQEWTQKRAGGVPAYADTFEGPDHERIFHAAVTVDGVRASGSGPSKKSAQREAAAMALELLAASHDDLRPRVYSAAVADGTKPRRTRTRTASAKKRPPVAASGAAADEPTIGTMAWLSCWGGCFAVTACSS